MAFSISLWLMPRSQGTKIMPLGQSLAMCMASWPAPEGMSMLESCKTLALARTRSITSESKIVGATAVTRSIPAAQGAARAATMADNLASCALRTDSSGWRMSMVKTALPGTVLGEPGSTSTRPMVKRSVSSLSVVASYIACAMRNAAAKASLRAARGVVPAWASSPMVSTM